MGAAKAVATPESAKSSAVGKPKSVRKPTILPAVLDPVTSLTF